MGGPGADASLGAGPIPSGKSPECRAADASPTGAAAADQLVQSIRKDETGIPDLSKRILVIEK